MYGGSWACRRLYVVEGQYVGQAVGGHYDERSRRDGSGGDVGQETGMGADGAQ